MKKAIVFLTLVLLVVAGSVLLFGQSQDKRPAAPAQGQTRPAEQALKSAKKVADVEPSFDRTPFKASAQSIARADLLACRNKNAALRSGRDADVNEFSRALNGVWLNHNRRSVHGMPVVTDAAFYIQMDGATGTAILIDRNNLGEPVLTGPFERGGAFANVKRPARPLSQKQVNCAIEFVDEYIKVTDMVPVEALARTTGVQAKAGMTLVDVWKGLVANRYFDSLDMPMSNDPAGPKKKLNARLGDHTRMAIMPDGTAATEAEIEKGMVPAAEYELPMLVGGIFRITLTSVPAGGGRAHKAVRMRWDAEYRGAGMGLKPGEPVYGIEQGDFVMEGQAFVSARNMFGTESALASTELADSAWLTSECGDKSGLDVLAAVSNPAARTETLRTALGETREVTVTPTFAFERFVIGTPGGRSVAEVLADPANRELLAMKEVK